jgi:hypothetical protein
LGNPVFAKLTSSRTSATLACGGQRVIARDRVAVRVESLKPKAVHKS